MKLVALNVNGKIVVKRDFSILTIKDNTTSTYRVETVDPNSVALVINDTEYSIPKLKEIINAYNNFSTSEETCVNSVEEQPDSFNIKCAEYVLKCKDKKGRDITIADKAIDLFEFNINIEEV